MRACAAAGEATAAQRGRLPAMFFQEALHGAEGGTIFPAPAVLGSTWDPSLAQQIYATIARDARALGSHMVRPPSLRALDGDCSH